jgi:hypothetical protein
VNETDREGRPIGPTEWHCPVCRRLYAVPPGGAVQCFCYLMNDPNDKDEHCPFRTILPPGGPRLPPLE